VNSRSVESLVADWLRRQAPSKAQPAILEAALDRVETMPQQRRIFDLLPGDRLRRARWLPVAIVLALLVAAVLGILAVGGLVDRPTAMTGFIAFVGDSRRPYLNESRSSGNADIYLVRSDGSGLRNLTNTPTADEMAPVWSPDGTRIAFIRSASEGLFQGPSSLVITEASTGRNQSTTEIEAGLTPWWVEWSPDGRSVMVSSLERDSFSAVSTATIDAATGRSRVLLRGADGPTHWSPDGDWLLVSTGDLFLVPAGLVGDQEIVDPSRIPGVRRLTFDERDKGYNAWAPDGSAIAFTSLGDAGMNEPRVELVNVATGDRSIFAEGAFSPAWAPEGRLIAYLKGGPHVWVASHDGSAARQVGSSFIPPKWSPDGAVLYLLDENGLYSVRPDGSGVERVTPAEFKPEPDLVFWLEGLEQSGGSNGCCGDFGPDWNPAMP
jgi:Tol biopolymer transport system component